MKITELRSKSVDELKKSLLDLRKEQFNMRFQRSTGSLEDLSRARKVRVDIARIKTLLTEDKYGKKQSNESAAKSKKK
jgi:large subunit ribosomal protein L29